MSSTPPLGSPNESTEASRGGPAEESPSLGVKHWSDRWSSRWLVLAIGVAVAGLAYGLGRLQGAMALARAEEQYTKEREEAQASIESCQTDRHLLEARRSLALVALSLDRRNFGVAETHRRSALQRLEAPALGGIAKVTEVTTTIRALDLAVDPDPGAEREQVIAVSEVLDGVLTTRSRQAPAPLVRAGE